MTLPEWVRRHTALFGLLSDTEVEMVKEAGTLYSAEFSPDELWAASQELARTSPPRFRNEHLALFGATLHRLRRARTAMPQQQAAADGSYVCPDCSDTGRVVVPSLRTEPMARATGAVTCRCSLGRWIHQQLLPRRPTSLDDYERHNPGWRDQVAAREERARREGGLRVTARQLDRLLGEIAPPMPEDEER